ncbi:hypothetical protein LMG23992_05091 [Cupriavidus laharis]|uniref:5-formyltetrahydrofolate cyclo-ligase n=1 Tax=Cupriavidus laharis TaxID=151654 RepID=A0ABM8XTY1_9BURK|nr:hypothetical protein [Cupriavidus laharis]CAG9183812.1 hypothetical protein LMG23992_05091 [Cupriavidus laharis]
MMNRNHRRTFLALSAVALLSTSGCATQALMKEANKQEYREYQETISQVLLTADGKKLVILGPTYHYIFDTPDGFAALLDSPLHPRLAATFSLFRVNVDADVEGRFGLVLNNPSDDERQAASDLGFKGPQTGVKRYFDLRGKRYAAGNFSMPASAKTLNQSYRIDVREALPKGGRQALVLMTPVTMAVDGVLVILSIPLMPIVFTMIATKAWY